MELPFDRVWLPYLYLYGVGGLIFFGGLFIVLKSTSFQASRPEDRRWIRVLLFGFFWYASLHGIGILAAIA
jgi:hypothetical protein